MAASIQEATIRFDHWTDDANSRGQQLEHQKQLSDAAAAQSFEELVSICQKNHLAAQKIQDMNEECLALQNKASDDATASAQYWQLSEE